jgi:hypothetical protein
MPRNRMTGCSKLTSAALERRVQGRPDRPVCHSHTHQVVYESRWACGADRVRSDEQTVLNVLQEQPLRQTPTVSLPYEMLQ